MPEDPTRRRDPRVHRAILEAAAALVSEVGYRRLSIEAIAARAGVGKQTIYRWWPSKGAVVLDAFMLAQEERGGAVLPETDDLRVDLRLLLRETVAGMVDPRYDEPYRAIATEAQHDPALAADVLERLLGPLLTATRERLERAVATGQASDEIDAAIVVELLYGPVFHRWLLRTGPLDAPYADALAAQVWRAVRP